MVSSRVVCHKVVGNCNRVSKSDLGRHYFNTDFRLVNWSSRTRTSSPTLFLKCFLKCSRFSSISRWSSSTLSKDSTFFSFWILSWAIGYVFSLFKLLNCRTMPEIKLFRSTDTFENWCHGIDTSLSGIWVRVLGEVFGFSLRQLVPGTLTKVKELSGLYSSLLLTDGW